MGKVDQAEAGQKTRGRYPKDYKSWILWEVALPLAAPLVVFAVLLSYWWATSTPEFGVRALISVSGTGDLFVFAAFLLINVGSKFRSLSERGDPRDYFVEGDIDPDIPFGIAIIFLLVYMGARIALEVMITQDVVTIKFIYGSASVIAITLTILWIDSLVCRMHIKQLTRRANDGLVYNYYNT